MRRRVSDGSPEPLGLTLDATGANIAVFSAHATFIELCLFDARGATELERLCLPCRTGDVFHGHFEGISAGQRYGLRAHGPYAPYEGHRFNPAKLLVDPYALALDRPLRLAPEMYGYRPDAPFEDLSFDARDSAPFMPKAIAASPIAPHARPREVKHWAGTIVYELHVRGFTRAHPRVPEALRGTFAGLAHPEAIAHLVKLGVTAVEIMPSAAWADERHLVPLGLNNYWGYNPIAFMAPDLRLAPGGWGEVRAAVSALQAAGIEVIIDIVLNHSGEGDALGPTLSLRGLDNATYYRFLEENPRTPINDTGCGNTLALDRPPVVRLAMDTLRAWALSGGVDGFRFDLATTLGRRDDGFDPAAPLLTAIAQDPVLRGLRMIAEPWDIGPSGYRIGSFPDAWGEWNDQFRDDLRQFWRGDGGMAGEVATRLSGSSDIFAPHRPPSRSINFIVAHDGFTLADLVSYKHKHNRANGEENRDGVDVNHSWNNGAEGATSDPAILAARRRDQRNLLASLMLARGTPMLAMGAEFGQTQHGNNNAYTQDNATAWLDWAAADEVLAAFTARLIALRQAHPCLMRDAFLTGEPFDARLIPDVEWRTPAGAPMRDWEWSAHDVRTVIAALYAPVVARHDGHASVEDPVDRVVVVLHAGNEPLNVTLPETRERHFWRVCIDTAEEDGTGPQRVYESAGVIRVAARSVAVLDECMEPGCGGTVSQGRGGPPSPDLLNRLARAAGIADDWHDIQGTRHIVPSSTKLELLAAMGLPTETGAQARESLGRLADDLERRPLPASLTAHEGEPILLRMALRGVRLPSGVAIEHEDGSTIVVRLTPGVLDTEAITGSDGRRRIFMRVILPPQPAGRHKVAADHEPDCVCILTVAPRRCFLPERLAAGERVAGIAAQLYAVRRRGDQGIGDLTTLAALARMAAAPGAATLGINPLHALFPADRGRASPYYPSDRRFLDPLYIDIAAVDGGERLAAARAEHGGAFETLGALPDVDYARVWAAKRAVLEAAFEDFCAGPAASGPASDFETFIARGGHSLHTFACFQAISELRGGVSWRQWSNGLAACQPDSVRAFAAENARRVRFHLYLQWLAEGQLAAAAAGAREAGLWLGLYRDLAVGAAPDGAEVWANAGQFLHGASVGAPPDPLGPQGQNWGFPPPSPLAWRASGYRLFSEVLTANMRHAGLLRIDHVMGLARLFVIPQGARPEDGAYLSYPAGDLIAQVALASNRAGCAVVGEDLGTVPHDFRSLTEGADILSYRVMWFERDGEDYRPPEAYPVKAVACVSTHDLPVLTGWWMGEDIREREALGLFSPEEAAAARVERTADKQALLRALGLADAEGAADFETPPGAGLIAAAHAFIARTPSLIAMAQLDDLAGERTSINMPGTDRERPNWRRRLGLTLEQLPGAMAALPPRR